jgi:alpha-tubulin suppressor-like RCC1 family protein
MCYSIGAGHTAKFLSAGMAHVCVIRDDNALLCWGRNDYGELGYGNTDTIGDDEVRHFSTLLIFVVSSSSSTYATAATAVLR